MQLTIPLAGPAREPVDFWRTRMSHGVADPPPMRVDEDERTLTATLPVAGTKPRTVIVRPGEGTALVDVSGPRLGANAEAQLRLVLRRVLNLDEDVSGFYAIAAGDPELAWAAAGAGRMLRSPTVFEEVVKTICPWITPRSTEAFPPSPGSASSASSPTSDRHERFPSSRGPRRAAVTPI